MRRQAFEPQCGSEFHRARTPGFVGADLENLINEAAILAARRNNKAIGQSDWKKPLNGRDGSERSPGDQ